jgi:hypothetical protein
MDINDLMKRTTMYSEHGSEYIRIHTIRFEYKDTKLFYGETELDATVHILTRGIYVDFHDEVHLRKTVGIVSFYQLNQLYYFDPSIRVSLTSTLYYTTKLLQYIHMLTDDILELYKSTIIHQSSNEIHFRLNNNCWITLHFIEIEYDGYLIEIIHNQTTLYKEEFKSFAISYINLFKV